mmetsp:Transcript_26464/g.47050  ORF Transcript_26464/g.47050 Transcript_26464/m.47050 type:complete len:137 (-) Transcript_26464:40-450(-)
MSGDDETVGFVVTTDFALSKRAAATSATVFDGSSILWCSVWREGVYLSLMILLTVNKEPVFANHTVRKTRLKKRRWIGDQSDKRDRERIVQGSKTTSTECTRIVSRLRFVSLPTGSDVTVKLMLLRAKRQDVKKKK